MHFSQYLYSDMGPRTNSGWRYIRNRRWKNGMPNLVLIGVAIILAGFLVVFLAMMMSAKKPKGGERQTQVRGGGVIMIGPIPIIFGSDAKWTSIAVVLAIALIVIVLFSGVLIRR
jgi:uncharacterized protein (TIGR00304 family)